MSDVFVSYKAEDRKRVAPLVEALEADGLSVWWDERIGGGEAWRQSIEAELDRAACVIVVWSKRSIGPEGSFVRDEAAQAVERGVYLPVTIAAVRPPLGFRERQAIALQGWRGDRSDPKFRAVLAAVRERMGGAASPEAPAAAKRGIDRRMVVAGGAIAIAAIGVGAWTILKPEEAKADSIAVLPFANLSGDPAQAYFSDGIAEEIRGALAGLAQLKVVARTSSELVRGMDAEVAAEKLDVANILTGSVRRSPTTVRISAQLVDGQTGLERWSATYDRPLGDTLKIQSGIALSVAQALSIELGQAERSELTTGGTDNALAQDLVLRAAPKQLDGTEATLRNAIGLVDQAIALDPKYAEAWARKSLLLSFLSGTFARTPEQMANIQDRAIAAAKRAIAIAPDYWGGHAVLGQIDVFRLDFPAALVNFERALRLGRLEMPRQGYATLLSQLGRAQDAWREIQVTERVDPLNADLFAVEASILFRARRYPEALRRLQHSLQLAPDNAPARAPARATVLLALGRVDDASKALALASGNSVYVLMDTAIIAFRRGDLAESDRIIAALTDKYVNTVHYQLAAIYAQRREPDRAFAALNAAWTYRDPGLANLKTDPFLDPIRSDPRFAAMLRRLKFP